MVNNYFANQNPTDIAIQSEDGGGMVFTKQGKFLFGSKLPDVNQQLNEEFYQGNVDIDPNTNSSYIAIMNAQSEPINVDIPSTNQYSLFTPPENVIIEPNPPKDDCENLFTDASSVLLNWENDNRNLGWDPYGANGTGIKDGELVKAQKYFQDNYWATNNKNTGDFSISGDAGANAKDPKLIINNLPGGLRIMAAQFSYNAKQWWTRILAAVGPDGLNSPGLGVPYKQTANLSSISSDSYNIRDKNGDQTGKFIYNGYKKGKIPNQPADAEFTLTGPERIQLFINQYDQIISAYQTAPVTFLENLRDETLRYYRSFVKGNNKGNDLLKFYEEYVNKAYNLAIKYANCPAPQIQSTTVLPDPNKSTESTPPPSPTPAVSLTAQEIEEGIYEANFLPASENEGAQLFELIPMLDISEVLILKDDIAVGEEVTVVNGKPVKKKTTTKNVGVAGKNTKEKIKNFFDKYVNDTLAAVNGSYVFPEVKLAQAIKESGYGKYVINIGNFFGITKGSWTGDYGLYETHEGGGNYKVNTKIGEVNYKQKDEKGWRYKRAFRHYKSVEEGFRDHTSILEKKPYKGYDEIGNPIGQGNHIGGVYATSPTYSETLAVIINELIPLFKGKYTVTKVGNKYKITVP